MFILGKGSSITILDIQIIIFNLCNICIWYQTNQTSILQLESCVLELLNNTRSTTYFLLKTQNILKPLLNLCYYLFNLLICLFSVILPWLKKKLKTNFLERGSNENSTCIQKSMYYSPTFQNHISLYFSH